MSERKLRRSPAWQLLLSEGQALLSGGADELYLIDEVPNAQAAERLERLWAQHDLALLEHDPELSAAFRQLQRIGAIYAAESVPAQLGVALHWLGDPLPALEASLRAHLHTIDDAAISLVSKDARLLLLVRSNASWLTTLDHYARVDLKVPQLFVDLAYAHTIAIGPYVVLGQTACVACLGNRVAHQWGDAPVPVRPKVHTQASIASALIGNALREFTRHGSCLHLLERCVTLDVERLVTRHERVFRLPECPVCHTKFEHDASAGRLPLPWLGAPARK